MTALTVTFIFSSNIDSDDLDNIVSRMSDYDSRIVSESEGTDPDDRGPVVDLTVKIDELTQFFHHLSHDCTADIYDIDSFCLTD